MPGADVVFDEFAQQNSGVDDRILRHGVVATLFLARDRATQKEIGYIILSQNTSPEQGDRHSMEHLTTVGYNLWNT